MERALDYSSPRVEHIGSTAVPGLDAKPVIDLLLSVRHLDIEAGYRPALE
ncbi:GrpB family protein [Rathayibacter sp. VKM Ac-2857]|nr:GrpB family protein [Rathayibacter sp. VKM Ac-2857]